MKNSIRVILGLALCAIPWIAFNMTAVQFFALDYYDGTIAGILYIFYCFFIWRYVYKNA